MEAPRGPRYAMGVIRSRCLGAWVVAAVVASCADSEAPPPPSQDGGAGGAPLCVAEPKIDALVDPAAFEYAWTCAGEIPPSGAALPAGALPDDCTTGVWPDLDETVDVCPTLSDVVQTDPVSGKVLPTADPRTLPVDIPVTESGSFLPGGLPATFPPSLRVVAWNMEYTSHLDDQIAVLTTHPDLASADVFLLSEVDRCSTRNDTRRAARLLAEALGGAYVYGTEFVELDIGRVVGGDTGQAIVSRRPMTGARLSCHSSQYDWFASDDEPRLGQRVVLHADIPVGDRTARVYAVHLESNDVFGEKRAVQSKELLDWAQEAACDRPQILAGDFNAPYCGAPELEVLRRAGFLDAIAAAGDLEPTHDNGFRLDYVWTRGFRVVEGGVVRGLGASDHDPVWAVLELE